MVAAGVPIENKREMQSIHVGGPEPDPDPQQPREISNTQRTKTKGMPECQQRLNQPLRVLQRIFNIEAAEEKRRQLTYLSTQSATTYLGHASHFFKLYSFTRRFCPSFLRMTSLSDIREPETAAAAPEKPEAEDPVAIRVPESDSITRINWTS